ncbi:MAG: zf-HC2 domain-containing protein [Acidobacteria bacterium]|nr:zf-HC2 domain-containing protein [Acidobacteriota bacterium]MCZ6769261.1 zf-HC2 domain-containing protein [Acidobacteriota bacterium]MCZ6878399.1 zf-HC2 domain-containing protein [Acidobacteriota bacterium]
MRHIFKCKDCFDLLMDYLEESLDPETHKKLDVHFAACPSCLNFLKSYRACSEMTQQLQDQQVEIPQEVEDRLKTFLQEKM